MSLELEYGEDVFCDLQEAGCFLRRQHPELGWRFTKAAQETFKYLSDNPHLGRPRPEFEVEGLRSWAVKGFRRYLIFYVPTDTRLRVLRVLEGSRDLSAEFSQ
jgi:toxin ParE1/3/4